MGKVLVQVWNGIVYRFFALLVVSLALPCLLVVVLSIALIGISVAVVVLSALSIVFVLAPVALLEGAISNGGTHR